MFYFFKRGDDTVQCEVRASADGPGFEIHITAPDGTERIERFPTSEQVHSRWLELHDSFERDGWWGPATQDGRGRRQADPLTSPIDVAIVGAGAAGLAAAIFTRRLSPARSVLLLDTAARPGAKILVSGGARCNVTNQVVTERDFWGGRPAIVRRVLKRLPVDETVAFFEGLGVPLHAEEGGRLFPDSHRARDVLDALLREVDRTGVQLRPATRVTAIGRDGGLLRLETTGDSFHARAAVLATGGQSLPKSGSDGGGFDIARRLGHTIVPTTPALVPLTLDGGPGAMHTQLSGVSQDVELALRIDGSIALRLTGSLLWTHFGISGPVVLNASRHWLRARIEGREVAMTASFCPGERFETIDARWTAMAIERPRCTMSAALAGLVPASVADAVLSRLALDRGTVLANLTRQDRRRLARSLVEWPLAIAGSRGYNYAEATAGGVALDEIDPSTMASRRCPGLHLVGEVLDVDGRIGGFNFQWAWSSARVAADALALNHTGVR